MTQMPENETRDRKSKWPGSENEVVDPLLPASERLGPGGRTSKERTFQTLLRSPTMWFFVVMTLIALLGVVVFAMMGRRNSGGAKDPLSLGVEGTQQKSC